MRGTTLIATMSGVVVLVGLSLTSGLLPAVRPSGTESPPVPAIGTSQQPSVRGVVFLDQNGNGMRDDGEPGVPDVVVSDQVDAVLSGADGSYRLEGSRGFGVVFVSLPSGYRSVGPFWRGVPADRSVDFPLASAPRIGEFTFLHASDPHISEESLPRMRKLRGVVEVQRPAFVLVTGDLVRDALRVPEEEAKSYYELYVRETATFPVPVWSVPGNHENFGIERHRSLVSANHPLYGKGMYRHYLGPNYYSFNYGGVHFVGLDTVDYEDLWYYGHIDETQLAWLERDLSYVPPGTTVVTFNHIPFYSSSETMRGFIDTPTATSLIKIDGALQYRHTVSNAADVLALLRSRMHTLALAGHIHLRETIAFEMHGMKTRFHQAAAVVGPAPGSASRIISGVTLYRVRDGVVDDGEFIPLDADASPVN